jgi:hypothetical protein
MFRQILNQKNCSSLLQRTFFKNNRSHCTTVNSESFLHFWSTLSQDSQRLLALSDSRPDHPIILICKGQFQKDIGEYEGAALSFREAAEMDENYKDQANTEIQKIENLLKRPRNPA